MKVKITITKMIKNLVGKITLIMAFLIFAGILPAESATYYAKANAKVYPENTGLVCVSASKNNNPNYQSASSASDRKNVIFGKSADFEFNLYAKANPGYVFQKWVRDDNNSTVSTSSSAEVTVNSNSTNKNNPVAVDFTAYFEPRFVTCNAEGAGNVAISSVSNKPGEQVTLTATPSEVSVFTGWYVGSELVSSDPVLTVNVTDVVNYTARFIHEMYASYLNAGNTANGYYRITTTNGNAFTLNGNFRTSYQAASVLNSYADFTGILNNQTLDICDPAQIFYVSGNASADAMTNISDGKTIISDLAISSQGVNPLSLLDKYGSTNSESFQLRWNGTEGKHDLLYSYKIALTSYHPTFRYKDDGTVGVSNGNSHYGSAEQVYLHPVDETHADKYVFGVRPSSRMVFLGSYWTSLYTAFPYKCMDGVIPYIVKEILSDGNVNYAVLDPIESGVVPANTAVILGCPIPEIETYADEDPFYQLMPLAPDHESIDASVADGNMLTGFFQLSESKGAASGEAFDPAKYRALNDNGSTNVMEDAGVLIPENDGAQLLRRNKAYLDLSKVNGPVSDIIYLTNRDIMTGIDKVGGDHPAFGQTIYDLYGRKVSHMIPGNIYIVNGRKVIARN